MDEEIINAVSKTIYLIWKEEKEKEGYHLPVLCPNYERIEEGEEVNINDDLIHCNKCLAGLVEYDELNNFQKKRYIEKAEDFIRKLKNNNINLIIE